MTYKYKSPMLYHSIGPSICEEHTWLLPPPDSELGVVPALAPCRCMTFHHAYQLFWEVVDHVAHDLSGVGGGLLGGEGAVHRRRWPYCPDNLVHYKSEAVLNSLLGAIVRLAVQLSQQRRMSDVTTETLSISHVRNWAIGLHAKAQFLR